MYIDKVISFENIEVNIAAIEKRRITGNIKFDDFSYRLIFTYDQDIDVSRNIAGLILTMPVINFTYFSRKLTLNFPVSETDKRMIMDFMRINAHEVFINKIINRRYDYIKDEYIPEEKDITEENASGITELACSEPFYDMAENSSDPDKVAIMSSGGKESLLAFGIFNEINPPDKNYAFYFEESGSHWLTAKTAYDNYKKNFQNTVKAWSNIDRFYHEITKHVKIIKTENIDIRSDDYPLQVFIFPVYIFLLVPLLIKYRIGNVIMGDELDDPREMGNFHGLKYYYGIFDQTHDFNEMISEYFNAKHMDFKVYSIVYPVTGYLEERILMERYHDLFLLQRSCHSCHEDHGIVKPCGKCTKCLGILLFIEANSGNPREIMYSDDDIRLLKNRLGKARMRLDPDEQAYAMERTGFAMNINEDLSHVSGIHILPYEKTELSAIPEKFRDKINKIFSAYSSGIYRIENNKWIKIQK
ncbi:MAG: metal-binding protein [Ferroplasma sp.]